MKSNLKAPPVYKITLVQILVNITVTLLIFLLLGMVAAYSVLLGGLISAVPNWYFARKAFKYSGARNTPEVVKAFYAGESGKIIMTAVMFALVFAGVKPLNELAVIISFIVTIVAGLIATALVGLKSVK